jgi:hypothetical protein
VNATILHATCGGLALTTISGFFLGTVIAEAFGTNEQVALVKTAILYLIPLLVALMASAGALGNRVGRGWDQPAVARKKRRMAVIAANGLLILVPCAYVLYRWANAGEFGAAFYAVQALELVAGGANITLLSLNLRDGLRLRHAATT